MGNDEAVFQRQQWVISRRWFRVGDVETGGEYFTVAQCIVQVTADMQRAPGGVDEDGC